MKNNNQMHDGFFDNDDNELDIDKFLDAIRANDLTRVRELIQKNPDYVVITKRNEDRDEGDREYNALHFAITIRKAEIAKELLAQENIDINAKDSSGATPLILAAQFGQNEIAMLLIEKGADINVIVDPEEQSCVDFEIEAMNPLLVALDNGHFEIAMALINSGADLSVRTSEERTPLHLAAGSMVESLEIVKELIKNNVDINARDDNGVSALHCAAAQGNIEIVKELIDSGANINNKTPGISDLLPISKPIDHAILGNNEEIVELLLDKNCEINFFTLETIISTHNADIFRLLIEKRGLAAIQDCFYPDQDKNLVYPGQNENWYSSVIDLCLTRLFSFENIEIFRILISLAEKDDIKDLAISDLSKMILCKNTDIELFNNLLDKADQDSLDEALIYSMIMNDDNAFELLMSRNAGFYLDVDFIEEIMRVDNIACERVSNLELVFPDKDYMYCSNVVQICTDIINQSPLDDIKESIIDSKKEGVGPYAINKKDIYGNTPMTYAVKIKNVEVVTTLLNYNSDADIVLNNGDTPLLILLRNKKLLDAQRLVEAQNLSKNVVNSKFDGCDALSYAIKFNDLDIVKNLVQKGVKIDGDHLTAALYAKSSLIMSTLLNETDPDQLNKEGVSVLQLAVAEACSVAIQLSKAMDFANYGGAMALLASQQNWLHREEKMEPIFKQLSKIKNAITLLLFKNANPNLKTEIKDYDHQDTAKDILDKHCAEPILKDILEDIYNLMQSKNLGVNSRGIPKKIIKNTTSKMIIYDDEVTDNMTHEMKVYNDPKDVEKQAMGDHHHDQI